MIDIAVLGASSQIAKDYIVLSAKDSRNNLILYVRDVDSMLLWLIQKGLRDRYSLYSYGEYGNQEHEVVINFVGVGDPAKVVQIGESILDITYKYDQLIIEGLVGNPARKYIHLSSGAVFGSNYENPVGSSSQAIIDINSMTTSCFYSISKVYAECRHRALRNYFILDIRIFNYFSANTNLGSRYFICDLVRSIKEREVFYTNGKEMVRDYIGRRDFFTLIECLIECPPQNAVLDCYTKKPVKKSEILSAFAEKFGLKYKVGEIDGLLEEATGPKSNYYSLNRKAEEFGYVPKFSSLDMLLEECSVMLSERGKNH